jgi:hypothetical protein
MNVSQRFWIQRLEKFTILSSQKRSQCLHTFFATSAEAVRMDFVQDRNIYSRQGGKLDFFQIV